MSKVLYIIASPRGKYSHSTNVADAFIKAYLESNPQDEVEIIDLFKKDLPPFDTQAIFAKYKVMHNQILTEEDKRVWKKIVNVIEEFKSADKYVFAVPMWNFSIPHRLKLYIDILVQPGYTFTITNEGQYKGLINDKPVLIFYARGGEYQSGTPAEAFDLQKKYLELILGFMGLTKTESIIIEPTLAQGPDVANQKQIKAIEKAIEVAKQF
jgi:FMN-dependent NADH-azoreductase